MHFAVNLNWDAVGAIATILALVLYVYVERERLEGMFSFLSCAGLMLFAILLALFPFTLIFETSLTSYFRQNKYHIVPVVVLYGIAYFILTLFARSPRAEQDETPDKEDSIGGCLTFMFVMLAMFVAILNS